MSVSQDDITDIRELSCKIQNFISDTLTDVNLSIGMVAVMNATTTCIFDQCETMKEILFYRDQWREAMDEFIQFIIERRGIK